MNKSRPIAKQSQLPKKIFLIRHGRSVWNKTKRISGQCDVPLSETGLRQAQMLAAALKDEELTAIYTSALSRTIATAQPAAERHNLPIQSFAALNEINHGILQGRWRDERDPEAQAFWALRAMDKLNYRPPEGENYTDLLCRVAPCLKAILRDNSGKNVLIVGHRNVNRIIIGELLQWPSEEYIKLKLRSKFLYEIIPGEPTDMSTILLAARNKRFSGLKV